MKTTFSLHAKAKKLNKNINFEVNSIIFELNMVINTLCNEFLKKSYEFDVFETLLKKYLFIITIRIVKSLFTFILQFVVKI
jgi:hypothetical protein